MKIRIVADLHLEFADVVMPAVEADVVVVAGDVRCGPKGVDRLCALFPDLPVVYVLGNHEYYGQAHPRLIEKARARSEGTNVRLLENGRADFCGVTFLGCTFWTDFRLCGNPRIAGGEAARAMTDYRKIRVSPAYRKLTPVDTALLHAESRRWLSEKFEENRAGRLVVVTHHAPSPRSLPPVWRDDLLSAAYASALDEFVAGSGAALWIHGHVHSRNEYVIGETRVVCNPRGYPDEVGNGFDPNLVLEI